MNMIGKEGDPIAPTGIEHNVEELWADEENLILEQRYNYLDYHFERGGRYCRARAYADAPQAITLFGPFVARGSLQRVNDPDLEQDVLGYLNRRFAEVKRL
jgi:hypothetical protein